MAKRIGGFLLLGLLFSGAAVHAEVLEEMRALGARPEEGPATRPVEGVRFSSS